LRLSENSITLVELSAAPSLPPAIVGSDCSLILEKEGLRVTRKNTLAMFAVAVGLSLSLTACKDTKTLQENEQLKAQVAELQKENGQVGNDLETVTADRDALRKQNLALESQLQSKKTKSKKKSTKKTKHKS
jgi:hypothetical protein